jgi:hypothetical protein
VEWTPSNRVPGELPARIEVEVQVDPRLQVEDVDRPSKEHGRRVEDMAAPLEHYRGPRLVRRHPYRPSLDACRAVGTGQTGVGALEFAGVVVEDAVEDREPLAHRHERRLHTLELASSDAPGEPLAMARQNARWLNV